MSLMVWDESYSVKIASIDEQHKKIIEMINQLGKSMNDGESEEALGRVLAQLINYTEQHFKYEEDIFERTNYPLSVEHKKEHEELKTKVMEIKDQYSQESTTVLPDKVSGFLRSWLINHIKGCDMKYSEHFLKNNIQ